MNALLSCYDFIKECPLLKRIVETEISIKLAEFTMKYNNEKGQIYLGYNDRIARRESLLSRYIVIVTKRSSVKRLL